MNFRPELSWEFLSLDQIEARTLRALRNHVKYLKESSAYYKNALWDDSADDIKSIGDFERLKFTTTQTVADNLPKFIAADRTQIVETVTTNGSSGNPLIFPLTANDLDRLAFNEALSFHGAGICNEDAAQIMISFDRHCFASMAYYRGLALLGCNTMRTGVLALDEQRFYIDQLKPSVVVAVPSFLKKLALDLQKKQIDPAISSIRKIICTGESLRDCEMELNAIGKSIQELWGAEVYSSYSSTEASVSYCECEACQGGHAHPELVYTEIVDERGNVLPDGKAGELVVTPLGVEGLPLLRYRTGDITFKITSPCSCGRNSLRIGPILGRACQLIKYRGGTVYPLIITNALDAIEEINDYILVIESDNSSSDQVAIHIATTPASVEKIANHLREVAGVNFPILVSNVPTIQSMRGSSREKTRILDWRKKSGTAEVLQ